MDLEPSEADFRRLLAAASEFVVTQRRGLAELPPFEFAGAAELLADPAFRRPPPESGRELPELLDVLTAALRPGAVPASPGYLAYVPGGGLVSAAVADLIAEATNRYTGLAFAAPGLVALEADVLTWMTRLFGLPPSAAGSLTTGGSMAILGAVTTARAARLGDDFSDGTLYITDQAHRAVIKAARLAGFGRGAVRVVPTDAEHRMDVGALRRAVLADRAAGLRPFCVSASAGTTNTGSVDPLPEIADLCADLGLWFHVDAAYGGFFQLTDRGRSALRGIERADSMVLDPHKSLFLPFGTGALLVADGDLLRDAHRDIGAVYLPTDADQGPVGEALPNFVEYSPELSRDFRGLRLWLPLHLHGVAAFRNALDDKLDLAAEVYAGLTALPSVTVPLRPDLSTVAFRCTRVDGDGPAGDAATAELLRRVNAERRVFLSSTRLGGRLVARICVLNPNTDKARIEEALDAVRRHSAALAADGS